MKSIIFFKFFKTMLFSDCSSDEDFMTFDDSDYHSASEFSEDEKIGCFDSCCNKKVFVLTKTKKHENMLLTLISKLEDPELKEEYLKKLNKLMSRKEKTPSKSRISLEDTLERFFKPKTKEIIISDLQHEISNIKNDIVELKKKVNVLKINNKALEQEILLSKLNGCFPEENSDNENAKSEHSEHTNEVQSDNMFLNDFKVISLINKVYPPK
jgi:cell division protein FtsB